MRDGNESSYDRSLRTLYARRFSEMRRRRESRRSESRFPASNATLSLSLSLSLSATSLRTLPKISRVAFRWPRPTSVLDRRQASRNARGSESDDLRGKINSAASAAGSPHSPLFPLPLLPKSAETRLRAAGNSKRSRPASASAALAVFLAIARGSRADARARGRAATGNDYAIPRANDRAWKRRQFAFARIILEVHARARFVAERRLSRVDSLATSFINAADSRKHRRETTETVRFM